MYVLDMYVWGDEYTKGVVNLSQRKVRTDEIELFPREKGNGAR